MNLHNGSDKSNSNKIAKATAAIPIAGILVGKHYFQDYYPSSAVSQP